MDEPVEIIHPKREGNVFISYARSDISSSEKIKTVLEQAGIRCWMDTEDIKPGEKWLASLQEALHQSQAMVVVCSEAAKESGYMQREFNLANELKLTIIPNMISILKDVKIGNFFTILLVKYIPRSDS